MSLTTTHGPCATCAEWHDSTFTCTQTGHMVSRGAGRHCTLYREAIKATQALLEENPNGMAPGCHFHSGAAAALWTQYEYEGSTP